MAKVSFGLREGYIQVKHVKGHIYKVVDPGQGSRLRAGEGVIISSDSIITSVPLLKTAPGTNDCIKDLEEGDAIFIKSSDVIAVVKVNNGSTK